MLTLYDYGNSVCCQKVRITLCAKGLEWNAVQIDLFASEQYDPMYLRLNPKGVGPTLVHDGVPVIESTLICEYLDERFPDPALVPAGAAERAKMRLWSKFVDEGLFEGITEISFSAMFRERMKKMPPDMRERRFQNIGDPRRRDRFRSTYEKGVRSPFVFHAIYAYERAFMFMESVLAEGGPWLLGTDVTLADINMMPFVARLAYLDLLNTWVSDHPHVKEWWARVQEWPSFRRGLAHRVTEGELSEMSTHGVSVRGDIDALLAALRGKRA
jgi:glutathione S-transferase